MNLARDQLKEKLRKELQLKREVELEIQRKELRQALPALIIAFVLCMVGGFWLISVLAEGFAALLVFWLTGKPSPLP